MRGWLSAQTSSEPRVRGIGCGTRGPPNVPAERCGAEDHLQLFIPPSHRLYTQPRSRREHATSSPAQRVAPALVLSLADAVNTPHAAPHTTWEPYYLSFLARSSLQYPDMRVRANAPHPNSPTLHHCAFADTVHAC